MLIRFRKHPRWFRGFGALVLCSVVGACAAEPALPTGPVSGSYHVGSVDVALPPGDWQVVERGRNTGVLGHGSGTVDHPTAVLIQQRDGKLVGFVAVETSSILADPRAYPIPYGPCLKAGEYVWSESDIADKFQNTSFHCAAMIYLAARGLRKVSGSLLNAVVDYGNDHPGSLPASMVMVEIAEAHRPNSTFAAYAMDRSLFPTRAGAMTGQAWAAAITPMVRDTMTGSTQVASLPEPL